MSVGLFAYGTLEIPELMQAVTGRRFEHVEALLDGFERFRLLGRPYPAIVERRGARTPGRLYRALDERSLATLDRFEGELYERRTVVVVTVAGDALPAHTYVFSAARRDLLGTEPWDRERFLVEDFPEYLRACREFQARGLGEASTANERRK